jgi:hypothetical protein
MVTNFNLFFDKEWLECLQVHLKPLVPQGLTVWDDTHIKPGSQWEKEIQHVFDEAKVAVLLVSADFLASDYIANTELPTLLAAAEKDGAVILPLIVSPSRFKKTTLAGFQAINNPNEPLIKLAQRAQKEILVRLTDFIEDSLNPEDSKAIKRSHHSSCGYCLFFLG